MKLDQILPVLKEWNDRLLGVTDQLDTLYALFGMAPEAQLPSSIYAIVGGYTKMVADRIDWDFDVLEDWCWSHNFGKQPMQIGFNNEPLQTISTIEELAAFIAADHEKQTA